MSDVLERLRADNPMPEGTPPSFLEVWERVQRDTAASGLPRGRRRRVRAAALPVLGVVPVAVVLAIALTSFPARKSATSASNPRSEIVHYHARTMFRPAADSGASFAFEITNSQIWVAGAERHRIDSVRFYSRDGRLIGSLQHELATNGRVIENFQAGPEDPTGELAVSTAQPQLAACPEITACGPNDVAIDPLTEVPRLYRSGVLRLAAKDRRLNGQRVEVLQTTRSGHPTGLTLLVDSRTLLPVKIIAQYGRGPWPASPVTTTTISGYRHLPLTPSNRGLLRMTPHPNARVQCALPGGGGPTSPPPATGCNTGQPKGPHAKLNATASAELRAAFAAFRRPPSPADELPAPVEARLAMRPPRGSGADPSQARHVGDGNTFGFLVPGAVNSNVCLVIGNGATCIPSRWAAAGKLLAESFGASGYPEVVTGVVPDGVTSVTFELDGGGTQTAPVRNNLYQANLIRRATTMTFTRATGRVAVAL